MVGFFATWWMGLLAGLVLSATGLLFRDHRAMFRVVIRALVLTLCVSVLSGITGFIYARIYLIKAGVNWWLPGDLVHREDFITVGSIHNFSYAGGMIGIGAGLIYIMRMRKRPAL